MSFGWFVVIGWGGPVLVGTAIFGLSEYRKQTIARTRGVAHQIIQIVTFLLLGAAALLAIVWWWRDKPKYEPVVTTLGLFAAITGLLIDRWVSRRERRQELLRSLAYELYKSMNLFADKIFDKSEGEDSFRATVYPRLGQTAVDAVIASDLFSSSNDAKLFKLTHLWKQRSGEFNTWLTNFEIRMVIGPGDTCKSIRDGIREWTFFKSAQATCVDILVVMVDDYHRETGITRDTTLFDVAEPERNLSFPKLRSP